MHGPPGDEPGNDCIWQESISDPNKSLLSGPAAQLRWPGCGRRRTIMGNQPGRVDQTADHRCRIDVPASISYAEVKSPGRRADPHTTYHQITTFDPVAGDVAIGHPQTGRESNNEIFGAGDRPDECHAARGDSQHGRACGRVVFDPPVSGTPATGGLAVRVADRRKHRGSPTCTGPHGCARQQQRRHDDDERGQSSSWMTIGHYSAFRAGAERWLEAR